MSTPSPNAPLAVANEDSPHTPDVSTEDVLSLVGFCRKHNAQVRITQGQNLHVQNLTEAATNELKLGRLTDWVVPDNDGPVRGLDRYRAGIATDPHGLGAAAAPRRASKA